MSGRIYLFEYPRTFSRWVESFDIYDQIRLKETFIETAIFIPEKELKSNVTSFFLEVYYFNFIRDLEGEDDEDEMAALLQKEITFYGNLEAELIRKRFLSDGIVLTLGQWDARGIDRTKGDWFHRQEKNNNYFIYT